MSDKIYFASNLFIIREVFTVLQTAVKVLQSSLLYSKKHSPNYILSTNAAAC